MKLISLHGRSERPGPHVAVTPQTLDEAVASARERNRRIVELEREHRRTARDVLFEVLDLSAEIATAVDGFGLSVAEFARLADIEVRRAQRVYKLAPLVDDIRQEVRHGEVQHGEDYECPSWKRYVPTASTVATSHPSPVSMADLTAELEAARKEIAELKAMAPPSYYVRHFQGGNDERPTPQYISDWLKERFGAFDLDVCADALNTKAPRWFSKEDDALVQQWVCDNGFMNPPFSRIAEFCRKAYEETRSGRVKRVVALLPSYVNNAWFQDFVWHTRLYLPRNRITFEGMKAGAPFGSVIAVWEHGYHNDTDSLTFTRIAMPKAHKANK